MELDAAAVLASCVLYALFAHWERELYVRYRMALTKPWYAKLTLVACKAGATFSTWTLAFLCASLALKYQHQ